MEVREVAFITSMLIKTSQTGFCAYLHSGTCKKAQQSILPQDKDI